MEKENILSKRLYDISKYAEIIQIVLIALGVFLVPLVIPTLLSTIFGATSFISTNSQYVVGSLVNTALITAGINVKGWKKVISVVTLPSISAIMSGLVFQTASIYTVYMIPAIWIGNFAIIYLYKYLFVNKNINYIVSSIIAILVKVAVIFLGFNLLLLLNIVPQGSKIAETLIVVMGMNQLITACIGSVISFILIKTVYRKSKKVIEEN